MRKDVFSPSTGIETTPGDDCSISVARLLEEADSPHQVNSPQVVEGLLLCALSQSVSEVGVVSLKRLILQSDDLRRKHATSRQWEEE